MNIKSLSAMFLVSSCNQLATLTCLTYLVLSSLRELLQRIFERNLYVHMPCKDNYLYPVPENAWMCYIPQPLSMIPTPACQKRRSIPEAPRACKISSLEIKRCIFRPLVPEESFIEAGYVRYTVGNSCSLKTRGHCLLGYPFRMRSPRRSVSHHYA